MERGLYAAASGMIAQQNIQDTLAQNIANASTVGYKQDNTVFRALQNIKIQRLVGNSGSGPQIGQLGTGTAADQVYTDWEPGPQVRTNNPLDVSLQGGQFFAVATPRGERYTRAGNFQQDGQGNLLTTSGLKVLDASGQPINTGGKTDIALDTSGNVTSNGRAVAQLKVVQIDPNDLRKDGNSLFAATKPNAVQAIAKPQVLAGTLEQSNVNTVRSLVQMITATRGFDMGSKAIQTQDELLKHAQNELGKL
jgi:flagellar basal-body rod protein FlgG